MPHLSLFPTVALVGRTNVGKSSLFNRCTERDDAMVSDVSGTTRDRKEGACIWKGRVFTLVDTGGFDVEAESDIERQTIEQAHRAIKSADLILFVMDAQTGPLPQDLELAKTLTRTKKPLIVVANKAESPRDRASLHGSEWHAHGLPSAFAVSALQGIGVGDLLDEVHAQLIALKKPPLDEAVLKAPRIALVGKPNVGKSSLTNALLDDERCIVSDIAHTTREPHELLVQHRNKPYLLIDTAGVRKSGKTRKHGGLEEIGVERTKFVLKSTDIALFVIDATEPISAQERAIAGMLVDARVGIIIVLNKWDLVEDKKSFTIHQYESYLHAQLPFITWAPIMVVSAKTGLRVKQLFEKVDHVEENRHKTLPQNEVDDVWHQAVQKHLPSRHKGPSHPKVIDMSQLPEFPPHFEVLVRAKRSDVLHPSYLRYLENRLRERFDLVGTPIKMSVRHLGARSLADA